MTLLDELRKKIGKKKQPTLKSLLRKQTGCSSRNIYVADKYIDLVSDEDMNKFLKLDETNQIPWQKEIFDCDDISRVFWNNAKLWFYNEKKLNASIGWIWSGGHAFNFFVNQALVTKYVEPQNDQLIRIHSKPRLVII